MKTRLVQDLPLAPRVPSKFVVVLRSTCVGVATTVVAVYLSGFIAIGVALHSVPKTQVNAVDGGVEVGWDLMTLLHNASPYWWILPILAFAAGFIFGFRYFSRART